MTQTNIEKADALVGRIDALLAETADQTRTTEDLLHGYPAANILRQARTRTSTTTPTAKEPAA